MSEKCQMQNKRAAIIAPAMVPMNRDRVRPEAREEIPQVKHQLRKVTKLLCSKARLTAPPLAN
jgi:hypothetical protein